MKKCSPGDLLLPSAEPPPGASLLGTAVASVGSARSSGKLIPRLVLGAVGLYSLCCGSELMRYLVHRSGEIWSRACPPQVRSCYCLFSFVAKTVVFALLY